MIEKEQHKAKNTTSSPVELFKSFEQSPIYMEAYDKFAEEIPSIKGENIQNGLFLETDYAHNALVRFANEQLEYKYEPSSTDPEVNLYISYLKDVRKLIGDTDNPLRKEGLEDLEVAIKTTIADVLARKKMAPSFTLGKTLTEFISNSF